jgi:hypothetical protein
MRQHLRSLGTDAEVDLPADQVWLAGPPPRYGTTWKRVPVTFWNWTALT